MSLNELQEYALNTTVQELTEICFRSDTGKRLCADEKFWARKFKKDYPTDKLKEGETYRRSYLVRRLLKDLSVDDLPDNENELIRYRVQIDIAAADARQSNLVADEEFQGSQLRMGFGLAFIPQSEDDVELLSFFYSKYDELGITQEITPFFVLNDDQVPFALYYELVPKMSTAIMFPDSSQTSPFLYLIGFDPESAGASENDKLPEEFLAGVSEDVMNVRKTTYINIILKDYDDNAVRDQDPDVREALTIIFNSVSTKSGLWMMNYVDNDELLRRRELAEERRENERQKRKLESAIRRAERGDDENSVQSDDDGEQRSRSQSPPARSRSQSPPARSRSQSPPARSRSQSPPQGRSRSQSPPARSRSQSPVQARSRSQSPVPTRSRSQSPPL